ncbi:DUF4345 family protein [Kribbella sindirgiensis]|uniref:DUF4345 domain-containing protein n=1 Tax=Kribbella sindirgiensis TaxID=1124744 RepID=A0A4R0I5R1_9ACTN|nr:DUF4345 family protein [Kribbella sindirgiensis]TCC21280.1 DUF4345 domain-containing protein [Kribbella sindirgiensis]
MRTYVRAVLVIFAALQLFLGAWLTFLPKSFYDNVPTVDWDPPFSEHAFRDFGSASLGLAIVLAAAAIRPERYLAGVALLAYVAFALPHMIFHLSHLQHGEVGWSIVLGTVVTLMFVVPASALLGVRKMT